MQKNTKVGNKLYPKESGDFANKYTLQRRGVHNDLVCQNIISKQVHQQISSVRSTIVAKFPEVIVINNKHILKKRVQS